MSRRLVRLGEQLRAEIARLLREEATDPRIAWVTLTRVEVSPDLGQALVYWSRIETEEGPALETVAAGLESAAPFLRRRLSRELRLRRIPELRFRHDPSLALGSETLALLSELRGDEE